MSTSQPAPTDRDHLRERYGAPRRHRAVLVGGLAVALAGLGWLVWAGLFHSTPPASSELVAWEVLDDRTAEARVAVVRRDADVEARCLVSAQAADHSVVGETSFTIGPGGPERGVWTVRIRSVRPATAVSLAGCVADGQNARR